jgi:hypothetical protein
MTPQINHNGHTRTLLSGSIGTLHGLLISFGVSAAVEDGWNDRISNLGVLKHGKLLLMWLKLTSIFVICG